MRVVNCNISNAISRIKGKDIVFFGAGSWLKAIDYTEIMLLKDNFKYVIDNGGGEETFLGSKRLPIYRPEVLLNESQCVIIVTSPVYMYDMYNQLMNMNLNNDIECYFFPFMQMQEEPSMTDDLLLNRMISDLDEPCIPKVIHSFWFSGEKKPELYQKCVDSWKRILTGYEIREWNSENYDWKKHPFVKNAVENEAWAFASDYARLDVLNEYGGIYLDMDVEVFKKFDSVLHNKAVLAFSSNVQIDLAVMASEKGHPIVQNMIKLYDNIPQLSCKEEYVKYFQPSFVRETLANCGIKFDGSMQKTSDGVAVFSKEYFMPLDQILFRDFQKNSSTYCVHYDNFGWSYNSQSKREKKMRDNRLLWKKLNNLDG